jgi:hypothetical protein
MSRGIQTPRSRNSRKIRAGADTQRGLLGGRVRIKATSDEIGVSILDRYGWVVVQRYIFEAIASSTGRGEFHTIVGIQILIQARL